MATDPSAERQPGALLPLWRHRLDLVAALLAGSAVAIVLGGALSAMVANVSRRAGATARLEFLAGVASPTTALLGLAAVAIVVVPRALMGGDGEASKTSRAILAAATLVSLVLTLLALNGIVLAFTVGEAAFGVRLGRALVRLGTVVLSGGAIWLAATASDARATRPPSSGGDSFRLERGESPGQGPHRTS